MATPSVYSDGFFVSDITSGYKSNLAAYSLHNSLANYARTADDLENLFLKRQGSEEVSQEEEPELVGPGYAVDACNAIVQFQHFLELFIKDILLGVNPLMVYDAAKKPLLLLKMANREIVDDSELEGVYFVEFSDALARVRELHNAGKLPDEYGFLSKYFTLFVNINQLRNRIAHRGAFVPRPSALDEIFGKHILPFLKELSDNVAEYSNVLSRYMQIKDPELKPFEGIIDEYAKRSPNEYAVYVYKLIATAGFNNKLNYRLAEEFQGFLTDKIRQAERVADAMAEIEWAEVKECPVCGCRTFIEWTDNDEDIDDKGELQGIWQYVMNMECHQCGFHMADWLMRRIQGNGLPLPDYYWDRKI